VRPFGNFSRVLHQVEREQKEITPVRNGKQIVRLIPEPPARTALEVLGDLYRRLDDKTAESLLEGIYRSRKSKAATLDALRNPWVS